MKIGFRTIRCLDADEHDWPMSTSFCSPPRGVGDASSRTRLLASRQSEVAPEWCKLGVSNMCLYDGQNDGIRSVSHSASRSSSGARVWQEGHTFSDECICKMVRNEQDGKCAVLHHEIGTVAV
jgi:hypothetical protein